MTKPLASLALLLLAAVASAQPPALPRSTPEAQGIPSAAILSFVEAAETYAEGKNLDALHSLMVLRHGHVVAEGWWGPYQREDPHVLFSLSKSFCSTAAGLAAAEGKLSLDDTVLSFFPEDAPPAPSENLKQMRVRDLLAMSTGHHAADIERFDYSSREPTLVRAFLALPVAHKPGTHFVYNTPATYMVSAIVQKATGQKVHDYLRSRLYEPLGIAKATWQESPQGISMGGFGLSVTTEDIARFGQLYLRRGEWNGKRLLPAEWVDLATSRQASNGSNPASDWDQGYGFQFWRCRNGAYRGDGAFGQYCVVLPKQDAVVAITSGVRDLQAVLNLVWEHLLPAMKSETALAADDVARARLQKKLASLSLAPQAGKPTSPLAREVSGRLFELPKNEDGFEAVGLETGAATTLVVRKDGRDHRVPLGAGEWKRAGARLPLGGRLMDESGQPVAGSGAWTADDTYTAKVCFYESPFCSTLRLWYAGRALVLDQEMNVGFGPTKRPQLVARPIAAARTAAR